MSINWQVRLRSPQFWTGLVGVVGSFAVGLLALFGVDASAEAGSWQAVATGVVSAVFGVLGAVGVVADPTTQGVGDSEQAMSYEVPKPKAGAGTEAEE